MESTRIFDLSLEGKFLFTYSDKSNYFIIFANKEDNKLYIIITDKYFEIENFYDIKDSEIYFNSSDIIFSKPYTDNFNEYVYKGFININGNYHKFFIENYNFILDNTIIDYKNMLDTVEVLNSFDVYHHLQRRNFIYFVGYDKKVGEDVFAILNIANKEIVYLNSFYSESEYFKLLNLHLDNELVIISGYTENLDTNKVSPFLTYLKNPLE